MQRIKLTILLFRLQIGFFVFGLVCSLLLISCRKLVDSEPPSQYLTDASVFASDATSIAAIDGIYITMNDGRGAFQGTNSISLYSGLSSDELTLFSGAASSGYNGYYVNGLYEGLSAARSGSELWSPLYYFIFRANAAIEGLNSSKSLTPVVKRQLLGEARFLRAFYYFYLVNLFGDVPLVLGTDPEINSKLSRSSKNDVYVQIVDDLKSAEDNLSDRYLGVTLLDKSDERLRPTKWAAAALLARVYLYMGEWAKAEDKASTVIDNKTLYDLVPLNNVFLKNSKEAIWQLQPTDVNFNTQEAQVLVIPQTGPNANNNPVYLSDTLLNSFESGDLRIKYGNWVDTTIYKITATLNDTVAYSNKYKLNLLDANITTSSGTSNMTEYFMILRLAEQYLIRAEARVQLGNMDGAKIDLNAIRSRAFSPAKPVSANDKESLLASVLHERQVELFMEWGNRWLDLKRTGRVDGVMKGITPLKGNGAVWNSYQQWYPLPLVSDLQRNPNLVQNDGY